jgi:hypothetical protein
MGRFSSSAERLLFLKNQKLPFSAGRAAVQQKSKLDATLQIHHVYCLCCRTTMNPLRVGPLLGFIAPDQDVREALEIAG